MTDERLASELVRIAEDCVGQRNVRAALGPYEFLLQFKRAWKNGRISDSDMAKWSHGFGYSQPSHALERLGGGDVWKLMSAVISLGPDGSARKSEAVRDMYMEDVEDNLDKAIREMKPYKGMTSGEAIGSASLTAGMRMADGRWFDAVLRGVEESWGQGAFQSLVGNVRSALAMGEVPEVAFRDFEKGRKMLERVEKDMNDAFNVFRKSIYKNKIGR